jgi:NAD(P)-dependent dehydrogenase (short-subunit alcohol dehydrogenase family)
MSSETHRTAHPDMNDLDLEHVPSGQARYGISKLFVIWNTQHFAAQLQQAGITNVTVNVSHPGMATTNFGQDSDNGFVNNLIYKVAVAIGKTLHIATPAQGAVTNIYLATDDAVKGISGKFFNNKKQQVQPATREYTPAKELALWNYCMDRLKPWIDEN